MKFLKYDYLTKKFKMANKRYFCLEGWKIYDNGEYNMDKKKDMVYFIGLISGNIEKIEKRGNKMVNKFTLIKKNCNLGFILLFFIYFKKNGKREK